MTTQVVCPQCNRPAEVALGEHPFCRHCDYPLFWVTPRNRPAPIIEEYESPPMGPVCVVCRASNEAFRTICARCGQPLMVVTPRRRRSWEAPPVVVVESSRWKRVLLGVVLGMFSVALLAAIVWALWFFFWPRSEWQTIVLDQGESSWDVAATLGRGSPVVSYIDASDSTLRVVVCGNPFCDTSQNPTTYTTIATVGDLGQGYGTAVAIGADGRPIIVFRNAARRALNVAHCGDPLCSDPGAITITEIDPGPGVIDPRTNVGGDSSIAIGTDGLAIISYHDAARGALKIAHCEDVACTSATIAILDRSADASDGAEGVGADTVVRIGSDGLPIVTFRDADEQALKIARCSDERCTQAVVQTVVREAGRDPGHDTSMVIAPDGTPVIAYADWSDDGVYVAKCETIECSVVHVRRVDHPEDGTSGDTALALGRNGYPVVAFRQREPGDERASRILKIVRCDDIACTSSSAPQIVDAQGRTGYTPRILILQDGTEAIVYGDATQGALEYALYR